MKRIIMILMCLVVLGTFAGCEDKVKNKEVEKETKKETQKETDKETEGLGNGISGYVEESRKSFDKNSCDYLRNCFNASMTDEDVYKETIANNGSKWMLVTFEDGMRLGGNEDYPNLKTELESILYDLSEPKVEGKVGYLITWTVDTRVVKDIKVETVDEKVAAQYQEDLEETVQVGDEKESVLADIGLEDKSNHVFDKAQLLTEKERTKINDLCSKYSDEYGSDIVILTIDEYNDDVKTAYTSIETYRYGDYNKECCDILFIVMDTRDVRIFSGQGKSDTGKYLTNSQCDAVYKSIVSDLSAGNFYRAFDIYLNEIKGYYQ